MAQDTDSDSDASTEEQVVEKRNELNTISDESKIRKLFGDLFHDRIGFMKQFDKQKIHTRGIFNEVSSSYQIMLAQNVLIMDDFYRMVDIVHKGSKIVESKLYTIWMIFTYWL